jgi:hypothetical protein
VEVEKGGPFISLRAQASTPGGILLLAVNPSSISHVTTAWSKEHRQTILRLHLVGSNNYVAILAASAEDVLIDLGLGEYVENYTLDLTKDLG